MRKRSVWRAVGALCAIGLAMMGCGGSGADASKTAVPSSVATSSPTLTAGVSTASSSTTAATATETWTKDCPGDAFCFSHPASLVVVPVQPIDSLAGLYRSDTMSLIYDLGTSGTSISNLVDPQQESVIIDGRPATVWITAKEIVLIVPKVYDVAGRTVKFSMSLAFNQDASRDTAMRIFQSIEFRPAR